MGSIYQRGNVWWIKYYKNGVPMRERSESDKETVAKNLLKEREGDIVRGLPVSPRTNRVTFDELAADVVTDYKVNGKKSIDDQQTRFDLHLLPFFGGWRAAAITPARVREYIMHRQTEQASNGSINRELSVLRRAFNLAIQGGKLLHKPYIPMLQENNVRKGFFEPAQFEAVCARLTPSNRPLVRFMYLTGWRVSEVLGLEWRQVDFSAGRVCLDPGTTKNDEGRTFPMTDELRELLEAQRAYTEQVQKDRGVICRWVFHRNGEPIRAFKRNWKTACKLAGCPGMLAHDFRRTAVCNLVRAGIPERVGMTMTGHKTRSVFERYNIVSEGDLREAARRLDAAAKKLPGTVRAQFAAERDLPTTAQQRK
jgi:integrase